MLNLKQTLNVMKSQVIFNNPTFNSNFLIVIILNYDDFFILLPVASFIYSTSPYIPDQPDFKQSIITYRAQIEHCWAKATLKRIFLIGEYSQGLKLSLNFARKLSPIFLGCPKTWKYPLAMWRIEGKTPNQTKGKRHQKIKHVAQRHLLPIFPDPPGDRHSLCPRLCS